MIEARLNEAKIKTVAPKAIMIIEGSIKRARVLVLDCIQQRKRQKKYLDIDLF